MKVALLVCSLLIVLGLGRAQPPTAVPLISDNPDEVLFARAQFVDEEILGVVAQNNTAGVNLLNCASGVPCDRVVGLTRSGVFNFGNKVAYDGEYMLISGGVGIIYVYHCPHEAIEECAYVRQFSTRGNSDPYSLVSDELFGGRFYASYPDRDHVPQIVVFTCDDGDCVLSQVLNTFAEDCLEYQDVVECFNGPLYSGSISLTASAGLLIVGFPSANNGRGLGLIYDCTGVNPACVINDYLEKPDNYAYSGDNRIEGFGYSISASAYNLTNTSFIINLAVGVPNAVYDEGYIYSYTYTSNFYTGGVYLYTCFYNNGTWQCDNYETLYYEDEYLFTFCPEQNAKFGTSVSTKFVYLFLGTPDSCNGNGQVNVYECTPDYCDFEIPFFSNDFYYGDGFGKDTIGSTFTFTANANYRGYIAGGGGELNTPMNSRPYLNGFTKSESGITSVRSPQYYNKILSKIENKYKNISTPFVSPYTSATEDFKIVKSYMSEMQKKKSNKKVNIPTHRLGHPNAERAKAFIEKHNAITPTKKH